MTILEKEIEKLRADYVHGSAWYFERISSLLALINKEEVALLLDLMKSLRPGMASLSNLISILSSPSIANIELKELSSILVSFARSSARQLASHCSRFRFESVLSISSSSAIKHLLMTGGVQKVYLMESRPGTETRRAAVEYSRYAEVSMLPDSAVSQIVQKVDAVVSGMDGVYTQGYFVNKLGTLGLCISANYFNKPIYVLGESFKATSASPGSIMSVDFKQGNVSQKVPLFDLIPLTLVNSLVTDLGEFSSPDSSTVGEIEKKFLEGILRAHEA